MLVYRIERKFLRSALFFLLILLNKKQKLPVTPGYESSETMVVLLNVNCLRLVKGRRCLTTSLRKLPQATRVKSTHCLDQVEGRIAVLFHSELLQPLSSRIPGQGRRERVISLAQGEPPD